MRGRIGIVAAVALFALAGSSSAAPVDGSTSTAAAASIPFAQLAASVTPIESAREGTTGATWAPLAMARVSQEKAPAKPGGSRKAILLSLLLPGAGEWSLGARGRARGFFIAEGAIWAHYVWYQVAGQLRQDAYIEQAQLNAGVGVSDADDEYWRLVGQYATSQGSGGDAYEESLRREARDEFPNDPAAQDAWVAERLPSGDRAWSWSSAELRSAYRDAREHSVRAFDRSKYSIAAAILNRLVSAIDTQIVRRKLARDQAASDAPATLLLADVAPDGSGRLFLKRAF